MASITVRNLDEDLKRRLRIRAAENGRSMEQERARFCGGAERGRGAGTQPWNGHPRTVRAVGRRRPVHSAAGADA